MSAVPMMEYVPALDDRIDEGCDRRPRRIDRAARTAERIRAWRGLPGASRSEKELVVAAVALKKLAHELRDPLSLILLIAERALRNTQNGNLNDLLEQICAETRRAEQVIQATVERAGTRAASKPMCDLNRTVQRAVDDAQRYSHGWTHHQVDWELDLVDLPILVRMNAAAIEQVVVNLIKNAVESKSGSLRIVVRTVSTAEGAEVVIADDGCGIPDEMLARVFEPFVSTKGEASGRGLGLSICSEIVADHGGQLVATANVDQGSVFTISLPHAQASRHSLRGVPTCSAQF